MITPNKSRSVAGLRLPCDSWVGLISVERVKQTEAHPLIFSLRAGKRLSSDPMIVTLSASFGIIITLSLTKIRRDAKIKKERAKYDAICEESPVEVLRMSKAVEKKERSSLAALQVDWLFTNRLTSRGEYRRISLPWHGRSVGLTNDMSSECNKIRPRARLRR